MLLSPSAVLQSRHLADLEIRHGFFTRRGGVSHPPWDELNFSTATGDAPEAVARNFTRAASWLGVAPERVYVVSQVHGCDAHILRGGEEAAAVLREEADVVVSGCPTLACGVRVADCAPLLLVDRGSGLGAAVHAGWRGVVRGVVGAAVAALRRLAGAPVDLVAAVGPHIESCCFEVGDDVADELAGASSVGQAAVNRTKGRAHVDLRRIIDAQLRAAAHDPCVIDHVRGCTVCDGARFHSYRRDGQRGGRMLAAVVPPGSPG